MLFFFLLFCLSIICLCTSLYSWSWMMLKYLIKNFIVTLVPTDTWSKEPSNAGKLFFVVVAFSALTATPAITGVTVGSVLIWLQSPLWQRQSGFLGSLFYVMKLFWSQICNIELLFQVLLSKSIFINKYGMNLSWRLGNFYCHVERWGDFLEVPLRWSKSTCYVQWVIWGK